MPVTGSVLDDIVAGVREDLARREEPHMSDNHGNTPAAWTGVTVAMVGFLVGGVGLMLDPVSMTLFWVGIALGVGALLVFAVMAKMGLNSSDH